MLHAPKFNRTKLFGIAGPTLLVVGILACHLSASTLPANSETVLPTSSVATTSTSKAKEAKVHETKAPQTESIAVTENKSAATAKKATKRAKQHKKAAKQSSATKEEQASETKTPHAVYRTVYHSASVKKTVTVQGTTKISWTHCPACGGIHAHAYTERVFDHYE